MKVKCVRLIDTLDQEVNSSPWLNIGEIYYVLSIFIDANGARSFSVTTKEIMDNLTLNSQLSECFEIISTVTPSNWVPWIHASSAIGISPKFWQENGFIEAFFEGDESAIILFKKECEIIISEDP